MRYFILWAIGRVKRGAWKSRFSVQDCIGQAMEDYSISQSFQKLLR